MASYRFPVAGGICHPAPTPRAGLVHQRGATVCSTGKYGGRGTEGPKEFVILRLAPEGLHELLDHSCAGG